VNFIQDFGILLLIIVAVSFLVKLIKQPIITGYVLSGLLFSLILAKDSQNSAQIVTMAELGITFLLFLMGLEFDLKNLKYLGKDVLISSLLQSVVFFFIAFGFTFFFDFTLIEKVYISILFMFSSTLLVAKWLYDKKETSTLHSKITMGILIIQDIFAIIAITFLGVLHEKSLAKIALAPLGGMALVIIAFILGKYLLNPLLAVPSRYPELLFISSLGVCFIFVEIAPFFGYSTTIGAFIGGVTLANTIYKNDIVGRLKPLIIFFNMLFFVGMGFQIKLNLSISSWVFIIIISALSLLVKPVITYLSLRIRGYDLKTSFLSGIHLAQLSEFGIIIIAAGVFSGVIRKEVNSIVIFSVIFTMIISSYLIKYDKKIFSYCEGLLIRRFEKFFSTKEFKLESVDLDCNIVFFGYYDLSREFYSRLEVLGKRIVVIENDPEHIHILKKEGIRHIYSSASDPEFLERLNFEKVELVISSLIDLDENLRIISQLKKKNPKAIAIVTAKNLRESLQLYNNAADYVLYPAYINEQQVSVLLEDYATDISKVLAKKVTDITKFKEKEEKERLAQQDNLIWSIDSFLKRLSGDIKKKQI